MITKTETDELFDRFVADNAKYDNDRKRVLNNFRNSEKLLRKYIETLSDLEKQQSRANFSEFQLLQQNMVGNLLQFDPRNIEGNIEFVKFYIGKLAQNENEFNEISSALFEFEQRWEKFLFRYPKFNGTKFDRYFKNKHQTLQSLVHEVDAVENMGVISKRVDQDRQELEKVIMHIEKIEDYIKMYIYIGEENEKQLEMLKALINDSDSYEVNDFFDIAAETIQHIDEIKLKSKKARVPVPVVKIFNNKNKNVYKYTLRFGDFTVLYENFFIDAMRSKLDRKDFSWEEHSTKEQDDSEEKIDNKSMKQKDTGQFVYLDNFPIDGIFSGKEVVNELCVSPEYMVMVEELASTSLISFFIFIGIIFLSTLITTFIGGGAVIFNVIFALSAFVGFRIFLKFLKRSQEDYRKMPDFFTFSKIDLFLFKEGDNFIIDDALVGAIYKFDDTILNKKYHEDLKKNMEYVKIKE